MVPLEDVSAETFDIFYRWSHQRPPRLPPQMTLRTALPVAEMAERYEIAGLENAVSDLLREQLRLGRWSVDVFAVNTVYAALATDNPVRELIRLMLPRCVRHPGMTASKDAEWWLSVGTDFPGLLCDFVSLARDEWPAQQIQDGGVCRFHRHRGARNVLSGRPHEKRRCEFALDEWYPAADATDGSEDGGESDQAEVVPAAVLSPEYKRS